MSRMSVDHEALNRKRRYCQRPHRHEMAPIIEGHDSNVLRCKCGVVMGFMKDPKKMPHP